MCVALYSNYLDNLAEEINDKLQDNGQVTIADLTKLYDLPADFITGVSKYWWQLIILKIDYCA